MVGYYFDREQIISLWQQCFGDTQEEILYFLDHCIHQKCIGISCKGKLLAMMFMVECRYYGYKGHYLYAVCTDMDYRKQGFMSRLMSFAQAEMNDFLWLIPAEDYLFQIYEKYGFADRLCSDKRMEYSVIFDESDEIKEYFYEGTAYQYPRGMIYAGFSLPKGSTGYRLQEVL